jgi:hypothetical protein
MMASKVPEGLLKVFWGPDAARAILQKSPLCFMEPKASNQV